MNGGQRTALERWLNESVDQTAIRYRAVRIELERATFRAKTAAMAAAAHLHDATRVWRELGQPGYGSHEGAVRKKEARR